MLLNFLVIV